MTDHELESRLRAWYRAELGQNAAATSKLAADVAAIPLAPTWRARWFGRRSIWLLVAAALLVVGSAAAGSSGIVRLQSALPPNSDASPRAIAPTSSPAVAETPAPVDSPTPPPTATAQTASGLVAFAAKPDARGNSALWIANADGTGAYEVAPGLDGCQGMPAWSPDGTALLFSRGDCGFMQRLGDASTRLYLVDPIGSAPRLLDTGCASPCVADSTGAFTSDGRRIVFVRLKSMPVSSSATPNPVTGKLNPFTDVSVLASMDLVTGVVTEAGTFEGFGPRWSPDGTQIAFQRDLHTNAPASDHFTSYVALFVADADGRNVHQISPSGEGGNWSPDGARIVFQGERYGWVGDVERWFSDIYTVRPDGTDLQRLTVDQISTNPAWNADGRIWFVRTPMVDGNPQTIGTAERWVMDADGGNAVQASLPLLLGQLPVWQAPVAQPAP